MVNNQAFADLFFLDLQFSIRRGFLESSKKERVGHVPAIRVVTSKLVEVKQVKGGEVVHVMGLTKFQPCEMVEFLIGVKGLPIKWGDNSIDIALIPPTVGLGGIS